MRVRVGLSGSRRWKASSLEAANTSPLANSVSPEQELKPPLTSLEKKRCRTWTLLSYTPGRSPRKRVREREREIDEMGKVHAYNREPVGRRKNRTHAPDRFLTVLLRESRRRRRPAAATSINVAP